MFSFWKFKKKKKKINVSRIGVNMFEWRDASPMVIRFSHKGIELTFITINDFSQLLLIEQIDFFPYDEIHTLNIYWRRKLYFNISFFPFFFIFPPLLFLSNFPFDDYQTNKK